MNTVSLLYCLTHYGVTVIVTVAEAPPASEAQVQVTVPLLSLQLPPPVALAEPKVTLAGNWSVITTLDAAIVPLFSTVTV